MKKPAEVNLPKKPGTTNEAYGGKTKEEALSDSRSRAQPPTLVKLQKVFREVCSNLAAYTGGVKTVTWNKVNVGLRDDGSWLAVLTYDDIVTFERMVCFGSGETFEGALVALSKSLAAGRVKVNKPYVAR